ncbi:MAG TPA: MmgE/PrpD family protein, partial [Chloroflexi bacterium]|nr:MmgE/PrpD family protein [Chloroflexota bacterium]
FGAKAPAPLAALANGSMAHALDFEDVHDNAPVHPNAATVPAALAVAESMGGVSGKQLLTAMALGSDLVCRLGLAFNENPLESGWYIPPILGAFGATAAAGKLLGLSAEQVVDAFSLTLCQATCSAELTHSPQSVVRSVRDAFSAQAGVVSALLAQRGVTGFDRPLEGEAGLFRLYSRGNYDPTALTRELGRTFEGVNVSFKPWPSCRGTHSYIDAILQIMETEGLRPSEVEGINLVVSPVNRMLCEPLESKQRPATAIDAKFSLPFIVATALVRGRVNLDDFAPEALADGEVLELARKVSYEVDPGVTLKEAVRGVVELETLRGSVSRRVDVPYGHPHNPISQEALVAKFKDCAGHAATGIPESRLDDVVDLVWNLEQANDVCEITRLL